MISKASSLQSLNAKNDVDELKIGVPKNLNITETDKVLNLQYYYSNYKIVKLNINSASKALISIRSWCDCLGNTKSILIPEIYVFDENSQPVPFKLHSTDILNSKPGEYSASLLKSWEVLFPKLGSFYLAVYSNNKDAGDKIGQITGSDIISYGAAMGAQINISSNLTSYPTGNFDISVLM